MPGIFDPSTVAPGIFGPTNQDPRSYLLIGRVTDLVAGTAVATQLTPSAAGQARHALLIRARTEAERRGIVAAALYVRAGEFPLSWAPGSTGPTRSHSCPLSDAPRMTSAIWAPSAGANADVADHPSLARFRLSEWAAAPLGERVAFVVSDRRGPLAMTFACRTADRLEIYEAGLIEQSPHRHVAYVESVRSSLASTRDSEGLYRLYLLGFLCHWSDATVR